MNVSDLFLLTRVLYHHSSFPFYVFSDGYYGIDCSMKVKKCGADADPDHVCANDGECVVVGTKDNGKPKWGCDCKGGTWAGQHCENAATQLCVISGDPIEAGEKGAFCTNGSTCVEFTEKKEPHAGCDCPVGLHGSKCQYSNSVDSIIEEISTPSSSSSKSKQSPGSNSSTNGGMSSSAVFIIVVVTVGSVLIVISMIVRRKMSAGFGMGKSPDPFEHVNPTMNLSPAKSVDDDGEFKEVHMI